MESSTLRLLFIVGAVAGIFLWMWRDRENIERVGILFFRRTDKGIDLIDRIAKRAPRFWKAYAWLGVVAAAVSIVVMSVLTVGIFQDITSTGEPSDDFGLVLPGTGDSVSSQPGRVSVPAEYWFISIILLMVVHELSHGIVARSEDFEINSVGVLVLGIIPGAFVEPEGEKMLPGGDSHDSEESHGAWHQGNWISRIKVLSAGSFANYLLAAVFLLGSLAMSSATTYTTGINYQTQEEFPAAAAGLTNGTLYRIGESEVKNLDSVRTATEDLSPGEAIELETSEGVFSVTATSREGYDGGYLGLRFTGTESEYYETFRPFSGILSWLNMLFLVVSFLNLGIGLFNMLPAKPLDGGHILDAVVERFAGEEYRRYVNMWSAVLLLSLIGVLVYSVAFSI